MGSHNSIDRGGITLNMAENKKFKTVGDLFDKAVDKALNNQQFMQYAKNQKSSHTTFGIDLSHLNQNQQNNSLSMWNSTKQSPGQSQQNHWTSKNSVCDFDLSLFDK